MQAHEELSLPTVAADLPPLLKKVIMLQGGGSKEELRKALRCARRDLSARQVARGSQRILRAVLGAIPFADFDTVALYWPIGNEVDLRGLASSDLLAEQTFALPVVEGQGEALGFRTWKPGDPVEKGAHGESTPVKGAEIEPGLLFVPLLGFDREGSRIGQGGGYYDRTLEKLRARRNILAVGLAFSGQECLNIPRENHDQPLDRVVTELEVITF